MSIPPLPMSPSLPETADQTDQMPTAGATTGATTAPGSASPMGSERSTKSDRPDNLPGRTEFIALMGMLTALVAFSIDSMMPVLPEIAAELAPGSPNTAQLVITSFVLGMGLGTLVTGPLSDRFGRRPVIVAGVMLYIAAAFAAIWSESMEFLLFTRLVQGLGAAGPRVVVMAVVRDLYTGRGMAQITSFIMMVFAVVPALAPLMGAQIVRLFDWHAIFLSFALFGVLTTGWFLWRVPETLPADRRRPFRFSVLRAGIVELLSRPDVRLPILVLALCFAALFATISSLQQIYADWLDRADSFPMWFGLTAIVTALTSYLNGRLVMRLGMRRLVVAILTIYIAVSLLVLVVLAFSPGPGWQFAMLLLWQQVQFFQAGLCIGNLNAIAMEPVGHIAGTAASLIGAAATVLAVLLAVPVGLLFNGTPLPLIIGGMIYGCLGLLLMRRLGQEEAS